MAERVLTGIGVSPGRGAGPVVVVPPPTPPPGVEEIEPNLAQERIDQAATQVREQLEAAAGKAQGQPREILAATALMATDPMLVETAKSLTDGVGPARAVWEAATRVMDNLRALGDPAAARSRDVADVRDRIIAVITDRCPGMPQRDHPFVLVAADLAPTDVALLDPGRVQGIVTTRGGPMSHAAILARALGIPAVMGVGGAARVPDGLLAVVDGDAGTVTLDVSQAEVAAAAKPRRRRRTLSGHGRTADGQHIPLMANVARPAEAGAAAQAGAEGVGLLRTEFCFLGRREPPTRAEQAQAYRQVMGAFPGHTIVVRTLDAGTDRPLPFLTEGREVNPALGVRGFRTFAGRPELLDEQLAAIAEAAAAATAEVRVMAPMVTTADDAEEFAARCAAHGLVAGVMIEVPAAALRAGQLLSRVAFASVGTNDLTQYTMAADRQSWELAHLCSPWQPAVLDLVAEACRAGSLQARPVAVCGEAAADPALAAVLVGLGAASLSMTPAALGEVAVQLGRLTRAECQELAALAVAAESAAGAEAAVRARLAS